MLEYLSELSAYDWGRAFAVAWLIFACCPVLYRLVRDPWF